MKSSHPEVAQLRAHLSMLAQRADEKWQDSLEARKQEEIAHSNYYREQLERSSSGAAPSCEFANRKWYSAAWKSQEFMRSWIRENARGKVFLDYACGSGGLTVQAAEAGAALAIGIDLSDVGLEAGRRTAAQRGLEHNTFFLRADCEATGLPDNSVDAILCSGMLHHLDLSAAVPEMRRILKPGGKCLAVETFKHNPLLWLYRRLTPRYRTRWEENHILGYGEIALIRKHLPVRALRHWHFFSLFAVPFRRTPLFGALRGTGDLLDSVLLQIFPLSLLAWQITFEMIKPETAESTRRAA